MRKAKNIIRGIAIAAISAVLVGAPLIALSRKQSKVEALSGSGAVDDPILISTSSELESLLSEVNSGTDNSGKYFYITNDLSINLVATSNGKTFRGHLDGGGNTITLSTNDTGTAVAMFNCVGSVGSVSNIVFDGTLSGVGQGSSTICRFNYGTISNITNNCEISSTNSDGYLGGIAAQQIDASALIQNCINNAAISGVKYVGGIVGNLRVGTISNSINRGNVTSSSTSCAGIAGLIGQTNSSSYNAIIDGCINEGNVSGTGQVGGIAGGIFPKLTCSNCSNYGNVSASANSGVGGIAGLINSNVADATFSFTNCYSSGVVTTGAGWAGGIFGYALSASLGTINFNNVLSASKLVNTSEAGNVGGFMAGQNSKSSTFNLDKCQSIASIDYNGSNAFSTGISISATNIGTNEDSNLAVNNKEHGLELSNTTIALLRAVRKFSCSYDASIASAISSGLSNLSSDEIELLDLTVHYGAGDYLNNYHQSALYIESYMSANLGGSGRIFFETNLKDNSVALIIVCGSIIAFGAACIFALRKRKSN